MKISLIQIPYDSGYRNQRMGSGPSHLVDQGLVEHLKMNNNDIELTEIYVGEEFNLEIGSAQNINSLLSQDVKLSVKENKFPLILAGNCNASLGITAGLQKDNLGIIWFDAHADFNTPETSISGFFDGMALSVLTGNCWNEWARSIEGFKPIDESRVVLIGARDVDKKEGKLLQNSSINHVKVNQIRRKGVDLLLPGMLKEVKDIYLHIDLDVFDPSVLKANHYEVAGGLLLPEFLEIIKYLKNNFTIAAVAFTAYDPLADIENNGHRIVKKIIDCIVE